MDFPPSLFPTFVTPGPPIPAEPPVPPPIPSRADCIRLQPAGRPGPGADPQFVASHTTAGDTWEAETPNPLPLLLPGSGWDPGLAPQDLLFRRPLKRQAGIGAGSTVAVDFTEQLDKFFWDHGDVVFGPYGKLMRDDFKLVQLRRGRSREKTTARVWPLLQDLSDHQPWGCPWAHVTHRQRRFSRMLRPVLEADLAGDLVGNLLQEELGGCWRRLLFDEAPTGGSLGWFPGPCGGQLVYPAGSAAEELYFQDIALSSAGAPQAHGAPTRVRLRGPVRQVVTGTVQGEALAAVRSDHHCAVWRLRRTGKPTPLQVLATETGATSLALSPHLPGELTVCTGAGAVYLWSLQNGLQRVRRNTETLAFHDPSPWRWADFTAHPRVLTIADRTGVDTADTRVSLSCGQHLFRVGAEAACQQGERVLLLRHLAPHLPTLHLVLTQFSLYLLDERLPLVPMVKWDHGLPSLPRLAQLLPPQNSKCQHPLLLGGSGGELRLLQISGKSGSPPQFTGPPLALPSLADALPDFPPAEPRSHHLLKERLRAPATGLAAASGLPGPPCSLLIFQLSAAGDVFYHRLLHRSEADPSKDTGEAVGPGPNDDSSGTRAVDHDPSPGTDPDTETTAASNPSAGSRQAPFSAGGDSQAADCWQGWLSTLLQGASHPPQSPWAPPTFARRKLLSLGQQGASSSVAAAARSGLLVAMAEGQLLHPKDLGLAPTQPSPAPGPLPGSCSNDLNERLGAAWGGQGRAWWEARQVGARKERAQRLRERRQQAKRRQPRPQLSSSFSSFSSFSVCSFSARSDLSDCPSPPHSPARVAHSSPTHTGLSSPAGSAPLQASSDLPKASKPSSSLPFSVRQVPGLPRERLRVLRKYLAALPESQAPLSVSPSPNPSLEPSSVLSQDPSIRTQAPSSLSSQPQKKRSRMGF
ncbi:TATA box-binding protein-associated factor RNA polymerase I subunit C [Tachyglossus aculeatus]|uniref:TATA box-binding protein-associated factor RNA polymerase I subunit C n=1 Tax=Tachyglossus aculeatus TaxID=9261 RepID=UPI0018F5CAAE|nr:TATA box-binding protein-associated factor RNA polymerase I subunit C [Tachyglossus aculeatus]